MKISIIATSAVLFACTTSTPVKPDQPPVGPEPAADDKPAVASGEALAQARQLLQAQDYKAAIQALTAVTSEQPTNGRAWLLLGTAYKATDKLDQAMECFHKALTSDDVKGQAMYNLGVAHAARNNPDEAFSWLQRARDSNQVNITQIGVDPAARSLRDDPRFAGLFPTREQFADPFVEDVRIIQQWVGEAEGDQFGWIARNIGDVDGDRINDVTTSAPTNAEAGKAAGKVYAYSGRTGTLLWARTGKVQSQLGLGIEAAGDVNADGVPDVIAGAPGANEAYVYSGKDGATLLTLKGDNPGDFFGRKVSDIGDINRDGHADVLVGAPRADTAGKKAGSAYVFSGKDGARLMTWHGEQADDRFGSAAGGWTGTRAQDPLLVIGAPKAGPQDKGRAYVYRGLTDKPAFIIESDDQGAALGAMFVSIVGDVNGDGVKDVYASDWLHGARGPMTGRIYVHSGADGRRLHTLTGEGERNGFGIGVADAGDVNRDGHDDLIIGAWQHGSAAPSGGKVYLYSGKDGALVHAYTGKVVGETFGFDATGMGDVDGDGVIDFLLTSAWSAITGPRAGRMYIVSGVNTAR